MSNRSLQDVEKSLPFREELRDHSGCTREFEISLHTVRGEVFGIVANDCCKSRAIVWMWV
jgi:hypothetical protein